MKFSFEGFKKVAKKTAIIGAGSLMVSTTSCEKGEKPLIQKSNLDSIEVSHSVSATKNAISYEKARNIFNQGNKDYHEGKDIKLKSNLGPPQGQETKIHISEENKILIQNLKKLEEKLAGLSSNESFKINRGSISILSSLELEKMNEIEPNYYTSLLDNRYITNTVSVLVFNKIKNVKLLDKNFEAINEGYKLVNEGYINTNKDNKFVHYIPEYYIVIDQTEKENLINFSIKILSPEKSSIREINIQKELPDEALKNETELENFVNQKIIPDIADKIELIIKELNLNNE